MVLTFDIDVQTTRNDDSFPQKTRDEIARCDVWREIECCHSIGSYSVCYGDLF
jgi:hypothetical protein